MKPNRRKFLTDQLTRYQSGKLDDKRKAIIDKWFDRETENCSANQEPGEPAGEEIFSFVLSRISVDKPKHKNYLQIFSAAAAIMLFIGIAIVMRDSPVVGQDSVAQVYYTTYQTAKGQEKKIRLQDGTLVSLKPGSSFRVPSDLGKVALRKVYLDRGEAFFSVKRDTLHPFSIRSGKYVTTVLGTSFNITAYPERKSYKVTVKTGKVSVERIDGKTKNLLSACLTKGMELNDDGISTSVSISGTSNFPAKKIPTEGHHVNLQLTLTQIGRIIARKYNLTVEVKSQQTSRKYAVKLDYQSLEQTLNELAMQTGVRYEIDDRLITITPGE